MTGSECLDCGIVDDSLCPLTGRPHRTEAGAAPVPTSKRGTNAIAVAFAELVVPGLHAGHDGHAIGRHRVVVTGGWSTREDGTPQHAHDVASTRWGNDFDLSIVVEVDRDTELPVAVAVLDRATRTAMLARSTAVAHQVGRLTLTRLLRPAGELAALVADALGVEP